MRVLWVVGLAAALLAQGAIATGEVEPAAAVQVAQESVEERKAEADRLLRRGVEQVNVSQFREALSSWEAALEIYREIGNRQGEASSLGNLGGAYHKLGQYEVAIDFHQQSLAIDREIGNRQGEAISLDNLGAAYENLGQYERAIDFHQQSLSITQDMGDRRGEAASLGNLGNVYDSLGQYEVAIDFHQQSLAIARDIGDRQQEANSLGNLGAAYENLGQYERAINCQQQQLEIARDIGDRQQEANSLGNLGNVYENLGQYQRAIDFHQQSLAIDREIGRRGGEAVSLGNLGLVYSSLGQYEVAIDFHQQSLAIAREIGDRQQEANSLGGLGNAYFSLGQYEVAIDFHQQSLAIDREIDHRQGEAASLGNLGNAYLNLGQYEQAIDFYQQQLEIAREIGDRRGEAASVNNLGLVYKDLGQYERAIDFHRQTLAIAREIGDRRGEAASLGNLGIAYHYLGQYEVAIDFFQQQLEIAREIESRQQEAISLGNLGAAYENLGQYERAINFQQQQLEIAREIGDRQQEAISLGNLGLTYKNLGQYERAIDFQQQSLVIDREINDREGEAISLHNLAVALQNTNQSELAIVFYKQSVNTFEAIRTDLTPLPTEDQQTYADKVAVTYENLADLLFQQGRPLEAQRVLDLLRVQQIDDYLRGIRGNANTRDGIDLFEVEEAFKARYDRYLNELVDLRRELSALQDIPPQERRAAQEQRRQALEAQLADADRTFSRFARQPEVRALVSQLQNLAIGETLTPKQLENLGKDLDRFSGNVALLSNFSFEDRLEIVVTAADGLTVNVPIKITREELNTLVGEFRTALADRTSDPLPLAQQLYGYLFAPLEDTFREQGIDAIVYAPNGILAYIPLAALHDGEGWLAQRYPVNQITALSLTPPRQPRPTDELSVLAGAFPRDDQSFLIGDRIYDYSGLPFAALELDRILELLPNTTALRDGEFSLEAIVSQMTDYGILHLATHAEFVVGEPEESFILFGNGDRANFIELEGWELPNTDIVVLSACETAVGGVLGDGSEMLGFGYLMQEAGAQVSIASLWQVSDGGTQEFMGHFYEALQTPGITRAEALRQAQVAMIRRGEGDEGGDRRCVFCLPEGGDSDAGRRVSTGHPYYWAPFVLIGNGL